MKASEGKLGRIFLLHLEEGDNAAESIERFAVEKNIQAAQVFGVADGVLTGIITPDADGRPCLRLPADSGSGWSNGEMIVQEVTGVNFRRVVDPSSGRETLARVTSTKTRVMEKPAPAPEESGPSTIPVYLFNAEIN